MHTCSGCEVSWTGMAVAHCASCHNKVFSGVTGFDRHRKNGKCLDPSTMKNTEGENVFELRTSGVTPTWAFPSDPDFAERFKAA